MRTTVDLPDSLRTQVVALARDTSRRFGQTVTDLIRHRVEPGQPRGVTRSPRGGLPVLRLGRVITTEDVRALADDA